MATLQDCMNGLNDLVEDIVDQNAAVRWFNQAQNRMASSVKAIFTQFSTDTSLTTIIDVPDKWAEALVLFAAAKYKEVDTALQEANNFMAQFQEVHKEFTENFQVPVQLLDDHNVQQFVATAGQTDFTITKQGFSPAVGVLKVFVNGVETTDFQSNDTVFTLTTGANVSDKVTALWEVHGDLIAPPYSWMGGW